VRGDLVFIEALIGVGEIAISDHRSSQPTLDELLRIASECHVAGLMTGKPASCTCTWATARAASPLVREALEVSELPARVFNPTHVNRKRALFAEAIELARAARPSISPRSRSTRATTATRLTRRSCCISRAAPRRARDGELGCRRLPARFRRRRPCLAT
jgi:hypothetical protein